MPNNPFDRIIINPREKPLSGDINTLQSQMDRALRFFAKSVFSSVVGSPKSGFASSGFNAVESSPQALSVVLKAGLGFQDDPADVPTNIDGVTGLDDVESYKPLVLLSDLTIILPTAPAGPNSRIDIIEVRADRLVTDSQGREVFNIATEEFQNQAVDKTMEFLLDGTKTGSVTTPDPSTAAISLKVGAEGTPGIAPPASAGYIKVAEIFVDSDVVVIVDADITDSREILGIDSAPPPKEIMIPAAAMSGIGTDTRFAGQEVFYGSNEQSGVTTENLIVHCPISGFLAAGDRLLTATCYLEDGAGVAIRCTIRSSTPPANSTVNNSDNTDSDAGGGAQTIEVTGIDFNGSTNILESGKSYYVSMAGLGNAADMSVTAVKLTFDTP